MWAFLPFGVLSIFIGLKKKKWKLEPLVYVCVTGLLALLVVYLLASVEYERLMDRKMWTAGSISFAFLPLKALFWMSVAMTIGWILARNSKRPKSW
jgi:predicted Co/Zn/Cd cation transporter (cation efflux family)